MIVAGFELTKYDSVPFLLQPPCRPGARVIKFAGLADDEWGLRRTIRMEEISVRLGMVDPSRWAGERRHKTKKAARRGMNGRLNGSVARRALHAGHDGAGL